MYSLKHCKSLWIKVSAKCINVNVSVSFNFFPWSRAGIGKFGPGGRRPAEFSSIPNQTHLKKLIVFKIPRKLQAGVFD